MFNFYLLFPAFISTLILYLSSNSLHAPPPACDFLIYTKPSLSIHTSHCIRVIFLERKKPRKKGRVWSYSLPRHLAHQLTHFCFVNTLCPFSILFPSAPLLLCWADSSFLRMWLNSHLPFEAFPDLSGVTTLASSFTGFMWPDGRWSGNFRLIQSHILINTLTLLFVYF